ncbi:MAG: hypothetical protein SFU53_04635 [Terrimicrobiaceae bacterium]|nr:hypothetical protein [Terrimicrobiaceae bacterium]
MLRIDPCRSAKDFRAFEDVAEDLHGGNPAFIPPFPGAVAKFLKADSAFHRRHGTIRAFIARRNGRAVGRIAAITNRTHNARYADRTGFFGFFECEENPETAAALSDAAMNALREAGHDRVRGPYNPSINDECGLLVEGHDIPPFIGLTWNPAYYEALVIAAGFVKACESYGYHLPLAKLEPPARLAKIVERTRRRAGVILRPIHLDRLEKELEIVHEIYNSTLERNWGSTPISMDELLETAGEMKVFADPQMILIAEMNGENAGVALSLPNINEILAAVCRTPRWIRPLHILWLLKIRRIRTARQVVYGISPRYRDKGGLHAWLLFEQFVKAKERFDYAELGWIEETNTEIAENSIMLGAIQHKTWRLYEKTIA